MPRDIEAQRAEGAKKDAAHQKFQKDRDAKRAAALKKTGKPVVAIESFVYPSVEQGGALRNVGKDEVFHPEDEPVVNAPHLFKEALSLGGTA